MAKRTSCSLLWGPHPQASVNEETTERIRLLPGKKEDLHNLHMIHKLILPHHEVSKSKVEESSNKLPKKLEPGTCLDLATGGKGQSCDGRSCMRIQSFQRRDLATGFNDVAEKEKSEVQICESNSEFVIGTRILLENV